jgi:hypothetical protein
VGGTDDYSIFIIILFLAGDVLVRECNLENNWNFLQNVFKA